MSVVGFSEHYVDPLDKMCFGFLLLSSEQLWCVCAVAGRVDPEWSV